MIGWYLLEYIKVFFPLRHLFRLQSQTTNMSDTHNVPMKIIREAIRNRFMIFSRPLLFRNDFYKYIDPSLVPPYIHLVECPIFTQSNHDISPLHATPTTKSAAYAYFREIGFCETQTY